MVTTVRQGISTAALKAGLVASLLRKDYPRGAPDRGHSYLISTARPAEAQHSQSPEIEGGKLPACPPP